MKITAVIAEYNPFHNGHKYQLEEIRRSHNADYIVVLMSGNFVQRGAPAICDKYSRAKTALACGADAVIELPVYWSVSSAENFSRGSVALLNALGCIDSLCFGCENPEIFTEDLPLLLQTADLLNKEPDSFKKSMARYQKEGFSYPAAKTKSLEEHLMLTDTTPEKMKSFLAKLNAPNNLLGFEYVRAIAYFHSSIKPAPVYRKGSSYHEETILKDYPSASSLRRLLYSQEFSFFLKEAETLSPALYNVQTHTQPGDSVYCQAHAALKILSDVMPPEAVRILLEAMHRQPLLSENTFSALLHFTLLRTDPASLPDYYDCSEQLVHRILKYAGSFLPWTQFCNILKTKNYTYTRISRCLLHILIGIKEAEINTAKSDGYACYARILGFRDSAKPLLTVLKKHTSLPLITNIGRIWRKLPENTRQMLSADLRASDIYRCLAANHAVGPCFRMESSGADSCSQTEFPRIQKPLPTDYEAGALRYLTENNR